MGVVKVPLQKLHISSDLITGFVKVAVRTQLPVKGVTMIVGNDLAGGKVLPLPEVIENPLGAIFALSKADADDLTVFPAYVITRAQSRKFPKVLIFLTVSVLIKIILTLFRCSLRCSCLHRCLLSVVLTLILLICYCLSIAQCFLLSKNKIRRSHVAEILLSQARILRVNQLVIFMKM